MSTNPSFKQSIYLIIFLSFFTFIYSANGSDICEGNICRSIVDNSDLYETAVLFETENYKYIINYPIEQPEEWTLFPGGASEANVFELSDGSFLNEIASIGKQDESFSGLAFYVLDRDDMAYKDISNIITNGGGDDIMFINLLDMDNKVKLSLRDINSWYNGAEYGQILIDIGENKVILIIFSNWSENKEQTTKEFYKIINSLRREKIK